MIFELYGTFIARNIFISAKNSVNDIQERMGHGFKEDNLVN